MYSTARVSACGLSLSSLSSPAAKMGASSQIVRTASDRSRSESPLIQSRNSSAARARSMSFFPGVIWCASEPMDNLNADRALVHVEDVFRFAVHQLETVSLDASLKLAFDRSLPEVVQVLLG